MEEFGLISMKKAKYFMSKCDVFGGSEVDSAYGTKVSAELSPDLSERGRNSMGTELDIIYITFSQ